MGRARQNAPPPPSVSVAVNMRLLILAVVLSACTPHPDTARRALLALGYDSIGLGEVSLLCAPEPGIRFIARDPLRGTVSGRVCCDRSFSCDVIEDVPR